MFGGVIWSGLNVGGVIFHGCMSGGGIVSFGAGCLKGMMSLPGADLGLAESLDGIAAVV